MIVSGDAPHVSIGLIVRNEESSLRETLDCILQQDFHDIELIIADNCSTDRTGEIATAAAKQDPRIRYHCHETNRGVNGNIAFVFGAAKGEYFVLAGAHDLWSPGYMSAMVRTLDDDASAVLACPASRWIDGNGAEVSKPVCVYETGELTAPGRFAFVLWGNQHAIYGMIRLAALRQVRHHFGCFAASALILAGLSVLGRLAHVPGAIWYRRLTQPNENRSVRIQRYSRVLFSQPRRMILIHWGLILRLLSTAATTGSVSLWHRIQLIAVASTASIRYLEPMVHDVVDVLRCRFYGGDS